MRSLPGPPGRTGSPRKALPAMALLALLLCAPPVAGDSRLETQAFGNLHDSRLDRHFPLLSELMVGGHVLPGLHRNFVPQGVDYLAGHEGEAVLSGYFCKRFTARYRGPFRRCVLKRSALYLFDLESGRAQRLALLEEPDGTPMRRHAGGVAELYERLWLPDNFVVFRFSLEALRTADEPVITLRPENERAIGVDASGDFITAHEGTLWIGNFQRGRRGNPLPAHYQAPDAETRGWTAGYRIDQDTLRPVSQARYRVNFAGVAFEVYRPDAALHHRNKVQGMTFLDDTRVVLSTSFGPRRGALAFHRLAAAPIGDSAEGAAVTLPDGSTLPVQSLTRATRASVISTPPGAEGVSWDGQRLAVPFEGGAMPYRQRWRWREDRLLLLTPPPDPRVDG
ncbi:hypothetical protein LMH63_12365 [Spiribacter halobius]|uniref:hypothetical protein n=1 Tax=Sediminicurvatus halobius TaxID=2182432 RepID=UPI0011B24B8E|nr:hypothetical protein [Spiribacter halobius]UEX76748.1 hypothetical protein LMH63_12365 [Spiribacter halobius]